VDFHPGSQCLFGREELGCKGICLLLERIRSPALDRVDAVDDGSVSETVVAKFVRERESLARNSLASVEEDE
jgi:hypothetical protein